MEQCSKAEEMHLKAIHIKEELLGKDDYEVALSVGHLARSVKLPPKNHTIFCWKLNYAKPHAIIISMLSLLKPFKMHYDWNSIWPQKPVVNSIPNSSWSAKMFSLQPCSNVPNQLCPLVSVCTTMTWKSTPRLSRCTSEALTLASNCSDLPTPDLNTTTGGSSKYTEKLRTSTSFMNTRWDIW